VVAQQPQGKIIDSRHGSFINQKRNWVMVSSVNIPSSALPMMSPLPCAQVTGPGSRSTHKYSFSRLASCNLRQQHLRGDDTPFGGDGCESICLADSAGNDTMSQYNVSRNLSEQSMLQ